LFYSYCFFANSSTACCFYFKSSLYYSFSASNFCLTPSVCSISSCWRTAWSSRTWF